MEKHPIPQLGNASHDTGFQRTGKALAEPQDTAALWDIDLASGAKGDRLELARVIRGLEDGDVLMVTRLDRLARSTRDLLSVLDAVAKQGAGFKSLKDTWADTTTPHGRLMLTVLGGLAEFERELIRARTGEGRKRARDRGVKFGRPRKLTAHQRQEALARLAAGETQADVARTYAIDPTTIGRLQAAP